MKVFYWILGILIVLAIGIFVILKFVSNTPSPTTSAGTPYSPSAPANTVSTSGTSQPLSNGTSITVQGGVTMMVKNFLQNSDTSPDPYNPGHYYLGYNRTPVAISASTTPPYVIEYISSTNFFDIALLQEPLSATRLQAEQYLMNDLGITQAQMCELNYTLSVPASINQIYAGVNLGFSFCPGAISL